VSALGLGQEVSLVARLGVHSVGRTATEAALDDLTNSLTRVGVRDLVDFVGVEPDLQGKA